MAATNYFNSYPSTIYQTAASTNNLPPSSTFNPFVSSILPSSAIPRSVIFASTMAATPPETFWVMWRIIAVAIGGGIGLVLLVSLIIWSFCVACNNNAVPTPAPPPATAPAPVKASPKKEKPDKTKKDSKSEKKEKEKKTPSDSPPSSGDVIRNGNNPGVTVIVLS